IPVPHSMEDLLEQVWQGRPGHRAGPAPQQLVDQVAPAEPADDRTGCIAKCLTHLADLLRGPSRWLYLDRSDLGNLDNQPGQCPWAELDARVLGSILEDDVHCRIPCHGAYRLDHRL